MVFYEFNCIFVGRHIIILKSYCYEKVDVSSSVFGSNLLPKQFFKCGTSW